MHIRSLLAVFAASALFACAEYTSAPPPSGSSDDTDATDPTTKPKPKKPSTPPAPAGTVSGTALDGTWDITAAGELPIGASEMTIKGGKINGVVVAEDEGAANDDDPTCIVVTDRSTFTFVVSGDAMSGTFTSEFAFSRPDCGPPQSQVSPLTATRTHAASNASGPTALEGDWVFNRDDASPLAITVAGLAAKVWDQVERKNGAAPVLTSVFMNGAASTASENDELTFAARKR